MFRPKEPPDVRVHEPVHAAERPVRRVRIALAVGERMVAAMRRDPPHHRAEERTRSERAEHPDQRRPCGERAVREITVEAQLDTQQRRSRADCQHDQVGSRGCNSAEPQCRGRDHGGGRCEDCERGERVAACHVRRSVR